MNCNVARDLLPLYFDGLCSTETVAQLEGHLVQCNKCRMLKQELEAELMPEYVEEQTEKEIVPFRKIKRAIRKRNRWIAAFACVLTVLLGITAVLFYGQITKKSVSFELLYEALRLQSVGKEFAKGNTEPLYEIIYDGYANGTEEAGMLRLAYADKDAYQTDMKVVLADRYRELFGDADIHFCGFEEIKYEVTPRIGEMPVIYASLRFEDGEGLLYFIGLYKTADGVFFVTDYFGNPYLGYESTEKKQETKEDMQEYITTKETLFSALPNRLYEYDFSMTRYMVAVKGRRALQGDTAFIENGQVPYVVYSEEDIRNNTEVLRAELEAELKEFAEDGYYLTDLIWNVKEYDTERHSYCGELEFVLTKSGEEVQKVMRMICYRAKGSFVEISGGRSIYEK